MSRTDEWAARLRALLPADLDDFLTSNSGLPGARANLELADAFAATADPATIRRLADDDAEYLRFCGTQGLGRLLAENPADDAVAALLRNRAADPLWRVREAAARALQLLGDADRAALRAVVTRWITDPDLYVVRAAVAAICEPRLLSDAPTRAEALAACAAATDVLAAVPAEDRRAEEVRTLRKGLGYCWSIAVAADPEHGLTMFAALRAEAESGGDADLAWIVRTNLGKARLRKLL